MNDRMRPAPKNVERLWLKIIDAFESAMNEIDDDVVTAIMCFLSEVRSRGLTHQNFKFTKPMLSMPITPKLLNLVRYVNETARKIREKRKVTPKLRVIVAGTRTFNNFHLLRRKLDKFLFWVNEPTIISGHAEGADRLGERYAKRRKIKLEMYPADWNRLGKGAGSIRNEEMAKVADMLILFWDGESRGSQDMLKRAERYKLKIRVVKI